MGLLSEGQPLSWPETKAHSNHVRKHGLKQFVNLYHRLKSRSDPVLKWGDEVEYMIVAFDTEAKKAKLALRAQQLLVELQVPELKSKDDSSIDLQSLWRPEYGAYMIEGTPGKPYMNLIAEFNKVERNMKFRRHEATNLLRQDEKLFSMSIFPMLGCPDFTVPAAKPDPVQSFTKSLFWPNEGTFPGHPRFKTLTRNIRERRGEKVAINMPVYIDEKTPKGYLDDFDSLGDTDGLSKSAAKPRHIYMDAMGFGMGLSCLQVTFQARNICEARLLYDQLAPLCPIFLALTASSSIFRGWLSDVDVRWDVISASVDCRTRAERGLEKTSEPNEMTISKSRYDSISSYLSPIAEKNPEYYNDIDLEYRKEDFEILKESGVDDLMAQHVAHLFIRDSVSLFSEKINQDDDVDTDHFENIQSTNWQTMRFKPPPGVDSKIGWRVEFRPCELQFTDFENAAVTCLIVLFTRVVLSFNYNLLIPISKVDENMRRAHKRDALLKEKFWFRRNISAPVCSPADDDLVELTVDQIFNGDPEIEFKGILEHVQEYLRDQEIDTATSCTLSKYWKLIKARSSGKYVSNAKYMRDFVLNHEEYAKDSKVTDKIAFDLLSNIDDIVGGNANQAVKEKLFGDIKYCD